MELSSWNGLNFTQKTVHLKMQNRLQGLFIVLSDTIHLKWWILKHCMKKDQNFLRINRTILSAKDVVFLSVEILKILNASKEAVEK